MGVIDFNKVVAYSKIWCAEKSMGLCATYVKNAFQAGGCKYISGDGWFNQKWCIENDFKCIGDFEPIDHNPRAHNGLAIQFPEGYVQQIGDVCLIEHGKMGHICYAMGTGINDWVSDYYQRLPYQQDGTGPYCYPDSITRVQFWRHSSVLNGAPVLDASVIEMDYSYKKRDTINWTYSSSVTPNIVKSSEIMSSKSERSKRSGRVLGTHMRQK